jgi:two-component system phosphate regulon sensor histidine kinase PhoR
MQIALAAIIALLAILAVVVIRWRFTLRKLAGAEDEIRDLQHRVAGHDDLVGLHAALVALGDMSHDALLLIDRQRVVRYMNAAARDLFHRPDSGEPADGDTVIAVTHHHELDDLVGEALHGGEAHDRQVNVQDNPYQVHVQRAEPDGGIYVVVAMEDIGELQRLGRARRDMVANISHELRTPITSIRLLVDTLLRSRERDSQAGRELLEKIAAKADTLHQLAQELLDLAMIESGRAEIILRPVPLEPIADEAVEGLSEMAGRKHITVEKDIPPGLPVLADADQVRRVLTNLLHNALKFTPPDGLVVIGAEPGREWVTVSVTDSGSGVTPEERQRIFERFYRGDRARRGSGTGLGLAIAKHIVEAHGGQIWAGEAPTGPASRAANGETPRRLRGAHICFTLPTPEQ